MNKRLKKLLDQVREAIRLKRYSIRTGEAYVQLDQAEHPLRPGT